MKWPRRFRLWSQADLGSILALLLMASGTLDKYAPPSESQSIDMYNGDSTATFLGAVLKESVKECKCSSECLTGSGCSQSVHCHFNFPQCCGNSKKHLFGYFLWVLVEGSGAVWVVKVKVMAKDLKKPAMKSQSAQGVRETLLRALLTQGHGFV